MKNGWIGIAVVSCLCLLGSYPASSTEHCIDGLRADGKSTEPLPPAKELPRLVVRPEMVESMQRLLWCEANNTAMGGPEDGNYFALTFEQVKDAISFWRARREPFPYLPDAWDCDDFAREFHHLVRIWSVRLTGGAPISPAVGVVYVRLVGDYPLFSVPQYANGIYHALNVIMGADGQWFFFEPQTGILIPIESPIYEGVIEVLRVQI